MKQIIITLLLIILGILGYKQYKQYKRFHSPGIDYIASKQIDTNYYDQAVLLNYFQEIEELNAFIRLQWSVYDFDVRNPDKEDQDEKNAFTYYTKKLGTIKFYENKLIASADLKKKGFTNQEIDFIEKNGNKKLDYKDLIKKMELLEIFKSNPEKYSLKIGDSNSFVFEIQRILIQKGYEIPMDGIYKLITLNAITEFQRKNDLYPDGKIDLITLNLLFR